ncbi:hypothetical protein L3Q82_020862 [Scortum barcoo]|uniref:Uncharacterized protein n=1 Tax=Scortum barcoo TaxID=214431 RepID=A0ACB8V8N2_9TELE|nr:hypothetical protein L3Q82_020862 [Scortum barcoo]
MVCTSRSLGLCSGRQEGFVLEVETETALNIIGNHLLRIFHTSEVKCLRREQRILKDKTPATARSSCYHLVNNTEVSTAVTPEHRAASFLRLWVSSTHPPHFNLKPL